MGLESDIAVEDESEDVEIEEVEEEPILGFGSPMAEIELPEEDQGLQIPEGVVGQDEDPDAIWDEVIDIKSTVEAFKATQPPGGNYDVPKFEGVRSRKEVEFIIKTPEGYQKVKRERPMIRYTGKGVMEKEGRVWNPRISFTISPTQGYKKDFETGEVSEAQVFDPPHARYNEVLQAYIAQFGDEVPVTAAGLDAYVRAYPWKVRTFQANDGLIVLGVSGVKV